MKTKKHPKANLENYSKLFAQLGLVLSLTIVYVLIQNKSFAKDIAIYDDSGIKDPDDTESNVIYKPEPPKVIEVKKKVNIDIIEEVDDDVEDVIETIIQGIDPDAPVEEPIFIPVEEPTSEGPETVPFLILEDAPKFPGCKGSKEELKKCFTSKIQKFINKKFDTGIGEEIGLSQGVQRVSVIFKIDVDGKIVDIQSRSPYKQLCNEAERVIKLLPQMEPGMQRGKPVKVTFAIPIVFKVE